jgi:hypothetical protein
MRYLRGLSKELLPILQNALGVWHPILSYGIGTIAIVFLFVSFQLKDRSKIIVVNMIGSLGWTFYFMLQGDLASGLTGAVSLIRTIIFLFRTKYKWAKSVVWLFVFLSITAFFTISTYRTWRDLIPLFATTMATLSFYMINEKHIRLFSMGCYAGWFLNSITKFYWIALVSDVCTLTSVIISFIKYNRKSKEQNEVKAKAEI